MGSFLEMIIQQYKIISFSERNNQDMVWIGTAAGYEYLWEPRIVVELFVER